MPPITLAPPNLPLSPVPPLEPGDRLTRDEFERRYHAMPNLKKAELIEGVVYMPSPLRWKEHGQPHADLMAWLGQYRAETPGVRIGDNSTIRLDLDNEPQPDAAMILQPQFGGLTRISSDGYLEGPPELICEISSSTVSIDMNAKLRAYQRNGVREYLVWRVQEVEIDWFALKGDHYEKLPSSDGILRSRIFPGLWLQTALLLRGDLSGVIHVLRQGMAGADHSEFAVRLRSMESGPQA